MTILATALDIEDHVALERYLTARGVLRPEEAVRFSNLAGGVSNRAVLVELPQRPAAWVLKQALQKLRVAVDWFCDPRRIESEALGLRHLSTLAPPGSITPLLFEDRSLHLLAMEAVPQPHENWKEQLLRGQLQRAAVQQFAQLLAAIHRHSTQKAAELARVFEDRTFFEALRLEPYYEYSAACEPRAARFIHNLIAQTRTTRLSLVHGDYSPKNILVHRERLVLLDHEVVHWGDPTFDVGFALTHLLSKAHHLPAQRTDFLEAARFFWQEYSAGVAAAPWAQELEARAVRHTLGCLLARVVGRSPLEYLSSTEKSRQREIVVRLMQQTPMTMNELLAALGAAFASNDVSA